MCNYCVKLVFFNSEVSFNFSVINLIQMEFQEVSKTSKRREFFFYVLIICFVIGIIICGQRING